MCLVELDWIHFFQNENIEISPTQTFKTVCVREKNLIQLSFFKLICTKQFPVQISSSNSSFRLFFILIPSPFLVNNCAYKACTDYAPKRTRIFKVAQNLAFDEMTET